MKWEISALSAMSVDWSLVEETCGCPDRAMWKWVFGKVAFVPKAMITADLGNQHWALDPGGFAVEEEHVQAHKSLVSILSDSDPDPWPQRSRKEWVLIYRGHLLEIHTAHLTHARTHAPYQAFPSGYEKQDRRCGQKILTAFRFLGPWFKWGLHHCPSLGLIRRTNSFPLCFVEFISLVIKRALR